MSSAVKRVGVLALQGDVDEHMHALAALGVEALIVKTKEQLHSVDGLIIPGGESTTVMRLLERFGLDGPIIDRGHAGMPIWGTCMGMIVIAREIAGVEQRSLDLIDITVRRNAFGRQIESAEVELAIPLFGDPPFPAVFIRAPWIERIGPDVELLAEREDHGVLVRERNMLASSFHPELTSDRRLHAYFVEMVRAT